MTSLFVVRADFLPGLKLSSSDSLSPKSFERMFDMAAAESRNGCGRQGRFRFVGVRAL